MLQYSKCYVVDLETKKVITESRENELNEIVKYLFN